MVEASEIFFGYCKYFCSLGLDNQVSHNTWSQRNLWFFDSLGRMLGYDIGTEDAITSDDEWKCPPKLKGKRTDVTWYKGTQYFFALEYQSSSKISKIKNDIQKLAVYPNQRVLIIYNKNELSYIIKIIQKAMKKEPQDKDSTFLLIVLPDLFLK